MIMEITSADERLQETVKKAHYLRAVICFFNTKLQIEKVEMHPPKTGTGKPEMKVTLVELKDDI
jgi:hypothetical protein